MAAVASVGTRWIGLVFLCFFLPLILVLGAVVYFIVIRE